MEDLRSALQIPPNGRIIACFGCNDRHEAGRDAVWAFDILRNLHDDIYLVLSMSGPEVWRIEKFVRDLAAVEKVRFLPHDRYGQPISAHVSQLIELCEVAWITNRVDSTRELARQILDAAPLVTPYSAEMADLIANGVSLYLTEPGNQGDLSRRTQRLLENPP